MIIQFFLFFCFVLPFTCEEMNPLYPDEKWEKVSPREVGIDAVKLQNLSKMGRDRGNIAVFRYGRLCFTDGLMAKNFPVYSVGKTLIAMIAGKLLREEKIRLDDGTFQFLFFCFFQETFFCFFQETNRSFFNVSRSKSFFARKKKNCK
jgi:Fe-S oxidoreductase